MSSHSPVPTLSKFAVGLLALGSLAIVWSWARERPSSSGRPAASAPIAALSEEEHSTPPASTVRLAPPAIASAVPPAVAPAVPAPAATGPAADDASLMERLRKVQDSDPVLARQLAEEGQRRFPNSPDAAERAALGIKALARQGRISEARGEAERMVNQYSGTQWALDVERNTGAHPHR